MYKNKKIALVVAAHNEEKLILPTLDKVPSFVDKVFVVDDGSTDSTAQLVRERSVKDPRVELISQANQGVGGAVITGYLKARDGKYDVTALVGGDDQMPMEQMERLLDPIIEGKADYVKGNRFLEEDGVFERMPKIRIVGNTMISLLTKIASGYYHIFDVVDGYTAISLEVLQKVNWAEAWKGYGFPMDFLVRVNAYGFRTIDVPRRAIYLPGVRQSQIRGFSYFLKVSPMLFRDFLWRLQKRYIYRDFHPLVFLFFGGAFFLLTGLIVGAWIITSKISGAIPSAGTAIGCALLVTVGMQCIFFAMLFEMLEEYRRYR